MIRLSISPHARRVVMWNIESVNGRGIRLRIKRAETINRSKQ